MTHYDYGFRIYNPAIGRFLRVDPLAAKYASISPYAYVANNPLNAIDIKGDSITPITTRGGGLEGRDLLTLKVTGKLINFSNNNVDMEAALSDIRSMMESSFQGQNIGGMDVSLEFNFSVAETMNDVESSDHLIVLAEGKNSKIPGVSNGFGGKVAAVDADYFTGFYDRYIGEEGERTAAHEMGHLFGLKHRNGDNSNLMAQGRAEFRGNKIDSGQLAYIIRQLNSGNLNRGPNTGPLGLPFLGIGAKVMKLTNTEGRGRD